MEFKILKPGSEEAEVHEFVKKWFKMYHDGAITDMHLIGRMSDLAFQMRDPDFEISGKKEFLVELNDVKEIPGGYIVVGRNGDKPIKVGDFLNNCRVEKIESCQHDLEELSPGVTACLTLKGSHLAFSMRECKYEWSWRTDDQPHSGV